MKKIIEVRSVITFPREDFLYRAHKLYSALYAILPEEDKPAMSVTLSTFLSLLGITEASALDYILGNLEEEEKQASFDETKETRSCLAIPIGRHKAH